MRITSTVWTSEKVDGLLKQIDATNKIPKETPFFEGDVKWRAANLQWGYTKSELTSIAKSQKSILHFASTCKVMTDTGIRNIKLRGYQRKCLVQFDKYRKNILLSSRQSGKCVDGLSTLKIVVDKQVVIMPIYKLFYASLRNKTLFHRTIYTLYRFLEFITK